MKNFKISKKPYTKSILKLGRFSEEKIFTQCDVFETTTGVIFFRFKQNHKKYLTDREIQCIAELESHKELLLEIFDNLEEDTLYNFDRIVLAKIREDKLKYLLE